MTKSDLITIIDKIRNRCALEAPTKVTYYWNDEGKVVFKIFFDSLYLPEPLRVDEDNIQNNFYVQDVYEYEDDFKILSLNQDEGYVEVLPDNQHFKIVRNYRDANTEEKKEENILVHLASKRLSETFAKSKGYLIEGETPKEKEINTVDGSQAPDEQPEKKAKPKKDVEVSVIGVALPTSTKGRDVLTAALTKIPESTLDMKVVYVMPKPEGIEPSFEETDKDSATFFEKNLKGKQLAYLGYKGNVATTNALEDFNVKKVYFLTDTAEKGIQQANYPSLLNKDIRGKVTDIVKDESFENFSKILEQAKEIVNKFSKEIKKKGTVSSKEDNFNERVKIYEEIAKSNTQFNLAIHFCEDVYGSHAMDADVEYYKQTKEAIKKSLQADKPLSLKDVDNDVKAYAEILGKTFMANMVNATGVFDHHEAYEPNDKSDNPMFQNTGISQIGNAALKGNDVTKRDKKDNDKKTSYGHYKRDFPVNISIDTDKKENSTFKSFRENFVENSDAPATPQKVEDEKKKEKGDKGPEDTTKDKTKNPKEDSSKPEEGNKDIEPAVEEEPDGNN